MKSIVCYILLGLSALFLLTECKRNDLYLPPVNSNKITWELNNGMALQNEGKRKEMGLKLLDYSLVTNRNSSMIKDVEGEILSDNSIIPVFDGVNPESFELHTMKYMESNISAKFRMVKKLYLDSILRVNVGIAKLIWEYRNQKFSSYCIYNKNGLLYDNIISNTIFKQIPLPKKAKYKIANESRTIKPKENIDSDPIKVVSESYSQKVHVLYTCNYTNWLEGQVGHLEINAIVHQVDAEYTIGSNPELHSITYYQGIDYNTNAYYEDGDAEAIASLGEHVFYERTSRAIDARDGPSYGIIYYAYGVDTRPNSVTISFGGDDIGFDVSFSGGGSIVDRGVGSYSVFSNEK